MHRVYMNEGIMGSPLIAFSGTLVRIENALVNGKSTEADVKKAVESADRMRDEFLKEENKII